MNDNKKDKLNNHFFFTSGFLNNFLENVFRVNYLSFIISIVFAIFICYLPINLLNLSNIKAFNLSNNPALIFKNDYAAISQFLFAIPIYIIARQISKYSWSFIVRNVSENKLSEENVINLKGKFKRLEKISYSKIVDIIILFLGFLIPISTLFSEHNTSNEYWYSFYHNGEKIISSAGLYAWFLSIPIYMILTLYWIRQIVVWIIVLRFYSNSKIKYNAFHPDRCSGLGFIKDSIKGFSLLIFSQGIVQVSTILYKVNIQSMDIYDRNVIVLVLSYIIIAPLLFIIPLTFFSIGLMVSRDEALFELGSLISIQREENISDKSVEQFLEFKELQGYYKDLKSIEVWPIDIKSMTSLFLSSMLPMLPIIVKLLNIQMPLWIIEILNKF